ncbi:hypothetical protein MVEN_00193800 [Mycena venus]|uniref:Stealth protein CR1 conserved region 1 domain-containing protein n=1 Tax=Mycena venus TaxID=2733690 RepID=A0A8H6YY95_9AGAR|nr:hypothetical protein MVEN_00193800 [Mycena venus]
MASRSLHLYQPLGWKRSTWHELLCNPVRCTAILLIVGLSLTSVGVFILVERPRGSTLLPNILIPDPEPDLDPDPVHDLEEPVPELIGTTVYHPFVSPSPEDALVDQRIRPIRAHSAISDACLEKWVSTGLWQDPCRHSMVQESEIDLVYVWVNGSDPLHRKARQALLNATKYTTKEARFREHDELRYSLRAARNATASWPNSTWHIITADVPEPTPNTATNNNNTLAPPDQTRRLGLVPQWLDIECAFYGCPDAAPPIRLLHDTQLFRLTGRPGATLKAADAIDWFGKILPSFNSHAVEAQLPHLDPEIVSDNMWAFLLLFPIRTLTDECSVALNDDQFMMLPLPPSAFHTTLYGQVFRVDPGLLVGGDSTGRADGGGEWRSLGWSAHLLNERFGTRKRPYMHHNARALSLPLLHEVSLAFGGEPNEFEVNTIFISTHYVIERHREALLWSWVVGKWGAEYGGMLNRPQKLRMWEEADRRTENDVEVNMLMAGLQPPRAVDKERQGGYDILMGANFHSLVQLIDLKQECIGNDAESAWNMFRRLLKDNTACGDNIISALIHKSKSGLDVFLPGPPKQSIPPSPADPIILPLVLPEKAPPLPSNPRAFAVRLLMRYAYVLGDSSTIFMGMKSATQTDRLLKSTDKQKDVALLCLNDDIDVWAEKATSEVLRKWFEQKWPTKLGCEV